MGQNAASPGISNSNTAIEHLYTHAECPASLAGQYAGNISPNDAWAYLSNHQVALIDVRTTPEWQFVGAPNVTGTPSALHMISWKTYPDFVVNADFIDQLAQAGISKETPCLFLCRSGGRSLDAALAATAAGWQHCFNIDGGFEGEPDGDAHRGTSAGWKAVGLNWGQN